MSVCHVCQMITFESLDAGSFTHPVHLERMWSLGQRLGHRSKQGRKSLFPQYKTSVGNNSGSVKHRAMKSVCSVGFSATEDQMVRLPSYHGNKSDHA